MNTLTLLHLAVTVSTMGMADNIARKDPERFNRLMSITLRYLMAIGIVFCLFEFLSMIHVFEELMGRLLAVPGSLTPISFMSTVSFLFLCSFTIEKWPLGTRKKGVSTQKGN